MNVRSQQLEKLSDLFLDLAKAAFIAAFAVPVISTGINVITTIKMLLIGTSFIYLGLKIIEIKEELR